MRLPRMTTRRWMVVVAVFGSSIGAYSFGGVAAIFSIRPCSTKPSERRPVS